MYLYTKRGLYHKERGKPSGDIIQIVNSEDFSIMVLSDGVSGCAYETEGARFSASLAIKYLVNQYSNMGFLPGDWGVCMTKLLKKELSSLANQSKSSLEEYSSTLMVLLIDSERKVIHYCNIGDGILLSIDKEKCRVICNPQGDEEKCPVTTTEGIEKVLETGSIPFEKTDNILMCTDGVWRTMYNDNIMKTEVKDSLLNRDYERFREYIENSCSTDDCSFVIAKV